MPDIPLDKKAMGLYPKYDVIKRETGELVTQPVFVLNLETDPIARKAAVFYAVRARDEGYEQLFEDLLEQVQLIEMREHLRNAETSLDKPGDTEEEA